MIRYGMYLSILLILNGCGGFQASTYPEYFSLKKLPDPTPQSFPHCHAYGCEQYKNITLTPSDWMEIHALFKPASKDAVKERARIGEAIALFENKVGPLAGTDQDKRGTFRQTGENQHDCVDESINTTIYMVLLQKQGLLKHHTIEAPLLRTQMNGRIGWPHQTAVIKDTVSGDMYAVDSWFRDNGYPALIVPLDAWDAGWIPSLKDRPEVEFEK